VTAARPGSSRVLITGCSTGIGRACAIEFARRGYEVVATGRDAGDLADLPVAAGLALDVTDDASVAAAVAEAGEIDVLVNNAGITAWGPVELVPVDITRRVFDTNVVGVLRVTQRVLPGMRERRRGRIVNVSSAALRGLPLLGTYAASKAALEVFTETLRLELEAFGVDVLLAEPGAVATALATNRTVVDVGGGDYAALHERAQLMLRGMRTDALTADKVAQAIVTLAECERPALRNPIGADAERLVGERVTVDDDAYEATVLAALWPGATRATRAR